MIFLEGHSDHAQLSTVVRVGRPCRHVVHQARRSQWITTAVHISAAEHSAGWTLNRLAPKTGLILRKKYVALELLGVQNAGPKPALKSPNCMVIIVIRTLVSLAFGWLITVDLSKADQHGPTYLHWRRPRLNPKQLFKQLFVCSTHPIGPISLRVGVCPRLLSCLSPMRTGPS